MHIIIGLITAIVGLVWALNRLQNSGVDINSFNPFHWARRRKWERLQGTKTIHRLKKPVEVATVLIIAIANLEGDITREQKSEIISLFENELNLSSNEAKEHYTASSYMLRDTYNITNELANIFLPNQSLFQSHHKEALITMLKKIANTEHPASPEQSEFIHEVERHLEMNKLNTDQW